MMERYQITGGVYLVVDPSMEISLLLTKLADALKAGLQAVQLWNNWPAGADQAACIIAVSDLCRARHVPLLIDNDWQALLKYPELNGVHFDSVPHNINEIREQVGSPFLTGVTCSGDLEVIKWSAQNDINYVSFCAMFPSPSAGSCSIVMPAIVEQARSLTDLPLFVSGGITPDNIPSLRQLAPFDGVAVISGIMSANDPEERVRSYQNALNSKITLSS